MTQAFNVRLKCVGNNRVPVLALAHPQSGIRLNEFRRLADDGDVIVARDIMRDEAIMLAEKLRQLGAEVTIEVSINDSSQ